MSVIDVERLTKDYGSGRGVFDVSFRIDRGEVFGFLGPNGAGKSTTVRHLMGFSRPDGGRTCIFGKESFSHYPEILNRVGYIPGEIALPAGLTGKEFLRMMRDLRGGRSCASVGLYRCATTWSPIAAVPSTRSAGVVASAMSRVRQPSSSTSVTARRMSSAAAAMSKL